MKRIGLLILSSLALSSMAQELSFKQNSIVGKDSLLLKRVSLKEFNIKGDEEGWSLKDITLSKKEFKVKYADGKNTIVVREPRSRMAYWQTEHGIRIIGMEDHLLSISYEEPEEWLRFPMSAKDTLSGEFSGSGLYCKQMPIQRFGTYTTAVERIGKLELPDGEELKDVTCLHTERQITDQTDKEKMPMEQQHYRWYVKGYRYPIIEVVISSRAGQKFEEVALYCPLEEQEKLDSDGENKAERTRAVDEAITEYDDGSGFEYEINNDGNGISVDYRLQGPAKIVALLASNQGYVYQRRELSVPAGTGHFDINTNGLRRGQYVVYLNVNGKDHAEKVNLK